jgi:amino acid transporter/nucleotide-binding universal stress UspA family protein
MLTTHNDRPRNLKWYHAGPLLYGDWGTSRFYVLGMAFFFALSSSFWYIMAVGVLCLVVGWAYTVVCRAFPDGGGVYSAARQVSPLLGVVGALLLFADYAVTAALSAFEGIHYFGIYTDPWVQIGAIIAIVALGVVNFVGARRAGTLALYIALATLALTAVMAVFAIPHLADGWANLKPLEGPWSYRWTTFTSVVLALSGVEAVANMTGIMVPPVSKTSKKSIIPVMIEIVIFNMLFGIAMLALPALMNASSQARVNDFQTPAYRHELKAEEFKAANPEWEKIPALKAQAEAIGPSPNEERMQTVVMKVMAEQFVHPVFGAVAGVVFGLLLISAVNTVLGGMISVQYVMAHDKELPQFFTKLNAFGVPWLGLIPAVAVPVILLAMFNNLKLLADLYAIGVVGAIAINLSCCTVNRKLEVKTWERIAIGAIAVVMIAIELTLATQKLHALVFIGIIVGTGLIMRFAAQQYRNYRTRSAAQVIAPTQTQVVRTGPVTLADFGTAPQLLDMSRPKILVATRGGSRTLEFAANYAKQINGILMVLYVRQLTLSFAGQNVGPNFEEDKDAQYAMQQAWDKAQAVGVPVIPIYAVSAEVADTILDFAATFSVNALLMGVSRQGVIMRSLQGDVLTKVADGLPQDIQLLIHA